MARTKKISPPSSTSPAHPPSPSTYPILACWLGDTDLRAPKQTVPNEFGPIARALLSPEFEHAFKKILILCNRPLTQKPSPDTVTPTEYIGWLRSKIPHIDVHYKWAELENPSDFVAIYRQVTVALDELNAQHPSLDLTFHLSPGTSAMSAIWLLLAKTTYNAKLLRTSKEEGAVHVEVPFDIHANFVPVQTVRRVERALGERILQAEETQFGTLHFRSHSMRQLAANARLVAPHGLAVLIEGESGTGKTQIAQEIHKLSLRTDAPFQVVNCGAIPTHLIESQLFGHVRGAFTGAERDQLGLIRAAHGGTLFLDEIGELPPDAQVKLLRVLQENRIRPVGSTREDAVDVRIIAATNQSLRELVSQNKFREDLYYRVSVAILRVPPLRERFEDLEMLIELLFKQFNDAIFPKKQDKRTLAPDALLRLQTHRWPGNVRELQNVLQRALLFSRSTSINAEDITRAIDILPSSMPHLDQPLGPEFNIKTEIKNIKKKYIQQALQQAHFQKTEAARLLGLSNHQTLSNWMHDLHIEDN